MVAIPFLVCSAFGGILLSHTAVRMITANLEISAG